MTRLLAITFALWWIATPAFCQAFLVTGSCGSPTDTAEPARAATATQTSPPCHGEPASAPARSGSDDDADGGCCLRIDLAVHTDCGAGLAGTIAHSTPLPLETPLNAAARETAVLRAALAFTAPPDRLHSPYARQNPPLLN